MTKEIEPDKGIAGIYEEIRPSYPEKLIKDVISKADLKFDNVLLEIGAGTGKATIQFAEKSFKIIAIEIGEDMAEILKDKCADYPSVSVDVASFEEWNSTNNQKYDMIYSAQAFHWIDKNIKYKKCHGLLKDKGHLILFGYNMISIKKIISILYMLQPFAFKIGNQTKPMIMPYMLFYIQGYIWKVGICDEDKS